MMHRLRRGLSRFGVRLYVIGLVQFSLVIAGMFATMQLLRPRIFMPEDMRSIAEEIERLDDTQREDPQALANLEQRFGWSFALLDDAGHKIGGSLDLSELDAPDSAEANGRRWPRYYPVRRDGRGPWWLTVAPAPPPVFANGLLIISLLAIVIIGAFSWWLARSVSQPLHKLSSAAHALGRGDLSARASLQRRDELGEVSRAFDHMAERLTLALRAERELLANVSHELRTPLQRIKIALELASEGDAAMARTALAEIEEDVGELERLVEDVLVAARPEVGDHSIPVRLEPTSLREIARQSLLRFTDQFPERELRAELGEEASDVCVVMADAMLLRRVFDNLLQNAQRYSDEGQPIAIRITEDAEQVVVSVHDRGIGLSAEDAARVFEPFFRADRSRSRATGGLGLGLTLSQRIVEAHRGRITLQSALGHGTTVEVGLPKLLTGA